MYGKTISLEKLFETKTIKICICEIETWVQPSIPAPGFHPCEVVWIRLNLDYYIIKS